jgi:hypothetical protein
VAVTVLVEVVRESVQRHGHDADPAVGQLLIPVRGTGSGRTGSGRAGADAGERPADAFAGNGGVGQGLLQSVLAEPIPVGVSQVAGGGCFQERQR